MANSKGNKRRLSINLSIFALNDQNSNKSPRSFEPNGTVGLGIVAAMNELDQTHDPFFLSAKSSRTAVLAVSPRTTPIPIHNPAGKFVGVTGKFGGHSLKEDEELSEGYTCVISHIGNNLIKKREYFDGVLAKETESVVVVDNMVKPDGVFSSPSPEKKTRGGAARSPSFKTSEFLRSCNWCNKQLHGRDIFMYRGEKAFCSTECRFKQISIDELKEKCGSEAMKSLGGYSVSPSSGPMQFFSGVAAA